MKMHFILPVELLLQGFQSEEVVTKDKAVIEDVVLRHAMLRRDTTSRASSSRMRGSSLGRCSLPIQVSSNFCLRGPDMV